jgi:hypothetical protein
VFKTGSGVAVGGIVGIRVGWSDGGRIFSSMDGTIMPE